MDCCGTPFGGSQHQDAGLLLSQLPTQPATQPPQSPARLDLEVGQPYCSTPAPGTDHGIRFGSAPFGSVDLVSPPRAARGRPRDGHLATRGHWGHPGILWSQEDLGARPKPKRRQKQRQKQGEQGGQMEPGEQEEQEDPQRIQRYGYHIHLGRLLGKRPPDCQAAASTMEPLLKKKSGGGSGTAAASASTAIPSRTSARVAARAASRGTAAGSCPDEGSTPATVMAAAGASTAAGPRRASVTKKSLAAGGAASATSGLLAEVLCGYSNFAGLAAAAVSSSSRSSSSSSSSGSGGGGDGIISGGASGSGGGAGGGSGCSGGSGRSLALAYMVGLATAGGCLPEKFRVVPRSMCDAWTQCRRSLGSELGLSEALQADQMGEAFIEQAMCLLFPIIYMPAEENPHLPLGSPCIFLSPQQASSHAGDLHRHPAGEHGCSKYSKAGAHVVGPVDLSHLGAKVTSVAAPCKRPKIAVSGKHQPMELARFVLLACQGPPPGIGCDACMHVCDQPACVNVHHLKWGTPTANKLGHTGGGEHTHYEPEVDEIKGRCNVEGTEE